MALVNHAKKEINAKIVYYGPAESGKSTTLSYIYSRIKPALRGDLRTVPAGADNLLFFDFSPFENTLPNGYRVRLHVYTLTGIVTNPATWKMTLKGADGIIIMANPAVERTAETKESVSQLRDFLSAYGVGLHETPAVLQLNSFTHSNQADETADIAVALDLSTLTTCRTNAASGEGLLEALTTLSRAVLERVTISEEPVETNINRACIPSATEAMQTLQPDLSADTHGMPLANAMPKITLLSQEIVCEGRNIQIPLEITMGDALRRLVVTVNVEVE